MNDQINIIAKALEKMVRESMKRDEQIKALQKKSRAQEREIEELNELLEQSAHEILQMKSQVTGLRGDLSQTNNRVELVTYETDHDKHLNRFMQVEAKKAAIDLAMTPGDISKGMNQYDNERVQFGMGKFNERGRRTITRFSSGPSHK